MAGAPARPTVVVAGAGAAGTLSAVHLVRTASRRATALDILLVDPVDRWARGVAFGTPDEAHLLNVPASGMSALPEDPGHFVGWLGRQGDGVVVDPNAFVPRRRFALYLDDVLTRELAAAEGLVSLKHLRSEATGVVRTAKGWAVVTRAGSLVEADGVVVATGLPQVGSHWAPPSLLESPFFVADPWAPGALDVVRRARSGPADVLVVGTGLTMVDVVLSLSAEGNRPDRLLHAVSRNARLPRRHLKEPKLAATPDIGDWGTDLAGMLERSERHLHDVRAATGDWRPAVDGLRFRLAELWDRLDEGERATFLTEHAGTWGALRHRMPPSSHALMEALQESGRLTLRAGEVVDAEPLAHGGLRVSLSDGSTREVGWVVNCTGPRLDVYLQ